MDGGLHRAVRTARTSPFGSRVVESIVVQPDGTIVIGGFFSSVAGTSRHALARLHPNGTLDTSSIGSLRPKNALRYSPTCESCSTALDDQGSPVSGARSSRSVADSAAYERVRPIGVRLSC